MKGIVFTELLELVEEKFGYEVVDRMISSANLENDGAFTAIGTYDHNDLLRMVVALSDESGLPVPALVNAFGRHLFKTFSKNYNDKIAGFESSFQLLEKVEGFIHVEVRKLYPDAELPKFVYARPAEDQLEIVYRSTRPFADLCEGLIQQCVEHFGESIDIEREDLSDDGTAARFLLTQVAAVPTN